MNVKRLPIVGVMGSSERANARLAAPLGRMLAHLGVHLLTGSGPGTMAAVAKAFVEVKERRGLSIGVVPALSIEHPATAPEGYPNAWVELPIYTHLVRKQPDLWDGLTRNHVNILTSHAVIALPGSTGTRHEIEQAVRYGKPVAAYFSRPDEMGPLPEVVHVCARLAEVRAFVLEHVRLEAAGER